jgi:catechol 2,3-dioxygenase-like lactoylglutathione lyase family enzyme
MAFHHIALGTKDLPATHEFYTRAMGFRLVKVVAGATPGAQGGWARHVFYDTGNGEMIAFWEIHDREIGDQWKSDHSKSLGLPAWVNHFAFEARTLDDLKCCRERWQANGMEVLEVDHGWCTSIYVNDPNGILVEFCCSTRAFTSADTEEAERLLRDPKPELESPARMQVHPPRSAAA